ncbi:hypothetical protein BDB00DRAFT_526260 [Zychaea mexicana]|uniref:uncharacterized protein n=1 Tax=Zychaea mexicana TaxID=64656 RepID=UPI0022FEE605|nr:uncharacterized protein BDB00DRAFT_526260 [Zychaea mexicana]KAI9490914.1 hypothetical protein BDB00DRAFT_526260 [Zychaea mexicana]
MLLGGMSSIDLHKPQQQQSGGMDFLSSSVLDSPSLPGRRERGSRFAKFFAKREEEATTPVVEELTSQPPTVPVQGKSISINDLFGRNLPQTPPQQQQRQQQGSSEVKASFSQGPPAPAPAPRMLSEEEVLQSLGAKRSPQQHKEKPSAEDAMGFDKVLQILSQPKPTSPYDIKKDEFVEQQESGEPVMVAAETPKQEQHNFEENVYMSSPKPPFELSQQQRASPVSAAIPTATHEEATVASPVRTPAEKQHMRTDSTDSAQAQKPKLVGKAFAGNLPTSVLRQMSARTSEGRSPSIASSKSANRSFAAGSSSAGGSPALSNHSPSAIKSGIPMVSHQQSNSPVQQLSYTSNAYQQPQQRMPATSPGYPLPGHSPIVDPIAAAGAPPLGRQPRNLEQLLQYGVATAAAGNGGGGDKLSPPVMPRSGMNGNGPMMGPHHPHHQPHHPPHPHHPFQGQGGMEQFIPPHLMQPMPPHMGPVGPGPMLQPHHLPPQLQGQAPHQFPPMQREMMTPPTSDHPAYMGNVPPPHMMGNGLPPHLFAKSQGWDRH